MLTTTQIFSQFKNSLVLFLSDLYKSPEYTGGCQSIPYTQPSCPANTDSRETAKYSTVAVSSCVTTLKNFWSGWMSSSKSNSLIFFLLWVATFSSHGVIRHKRIKESCELLARRRWPESVDKNS